MKNYETVLNDLAAIPSATAGAVRDITWLTPVDVIGVARDQAGHLEIFLAGMQLKPRTAALRDAMEHHEWHRTSGQRIAANRLLLPALGHFDQVGAFICAELLRNGADQDLARAFAITEPIIELAVERLMMSHAAMLGLVGELLLLSSMCRQAPDHLVALVVQSWDGWRRSARDFRWDRTGVELKTTTRATSSHVIQGVHQIEPSAAGDEDSPEDRLLLVSVGLQTAQAGASSFSITTLVQRILDRLLATGNAGLQKGFLANLSAYGSESGFGYDHATMSAEPPFTALFVTTFFRGYDMSDPGVEVLRRDDVAPHPHVEISSVRFRINLPSVITGQNPISGANQVARSILGV